MPSTSTATSAGSSGARRATPSPSAPSTCLKNCRRGDVRRHHVQAREGRREGAGARAAGQGPRLPLPHRAHAPAVRPLRLPAALQGLSGQPAQLQGGHRPGRVPREHRGPLRGRRVQPRARRSWRDTLQKLSKPFAAFANLRGDEYAISCKINTQKGSERIVRAAFEFAKKYGRKKVTVVHKANVVRATDGLFLEMRQAGRRRLPDHQDGRRQHRRRSRCGCSRTRSTTTCWSRRTSTATSSPTSAPRWSAASASAARATSATSSRCSSPRTARRPSTPGSTRSTLSPPSWPPR